MNIGSHVVQEQRNVRFPVLSFGLNRANHVTPTEQLHKVLRI